MHRFRFKTSPVSSSADNRFDNAASAGPAFNASHIDSLADELHAKKRRKKSSLLLKSPPKENTRVNLSPLMSTFNSPRYTSSRLRRRRVQKRIFTQAEELPMTSMHQELAASFQATSVVDDVRDVDNHWSPPTGLAVSQPMSPWPDLGASPISLQIAATQIVDNDEDAISPEAQQALTSAVNLANTESPQLPSPIVFAPETPPSQFSRVAMPQRLSSGLSSVVIPETPPSQRGEADNAMSPLASMRPGTQSNPLVVPDSPDQAINNQLAQAAASADVQSALVSRRSQRTTKGRLSFYYLVSKNPANWFSVLNRKLSVIPDASGVVGPIIPSDNETVKNMSGTLKGRLRGSRVIHGLIETGVQWQSPIYALIKIPKSNLKDFNVDKQCRIAADIQRHMEATIDEDIRPKHVLAFEVEQIVKIEDSLATLGRRISHVINANQRFPAFMFITPCGQHTRLYSPREALHSAGVKHTQVPLNHFSQFSSPVMKNRQQFFRASVDKFAAEFEKTNEAYIDVMRDKLNALTDFFKDVMVKIQHSNGIERVDLNLLRSGIDELLAHHKSIQGFLEQLLTSIHAEIMPIETSFQENRLFSGLVSSITRLQNNITDKAAHYENVQSVVSEKGVRAYLEAFKNCVESQSDEFQHQQAPRVISCV